ncbi:MAG: ATP synthase F0 subunit B [Nitrospiraceae bacterium]|nr:ATP synthase F0 subunit B [Nitrospiraceae bacterium]
MLDIHLKWLLLLMANFLGLIFILNIILFKPLLKIFRERKETVKSSLDAAKDMAARKEEGLARMQKEISDARQKAKEVFEGLRGEGVQQQKSELSAAEAKGAEMLQSAREELRREVEKARQALKADVEKFSDEIVRKLVKA